MQGVFNTVTDVVKILGVKRISVKHLGTQNSWMLFLCLENFLPSEFVPSQGRSQKWAFPVSLELRSSQSDDTCARLQLGGH